MWIEALHVDHPIGMAVYGLTLAIAHQVAGRPLNLADSRPGRDQIAHGGGPKGSVSSDPTHALVSRLCGCRLLLAVASRRAPGKG